MNLMEIISYKNMPCPGNHVTLQILRESLSRNIPDNAIGLPLYRCSLLLETDPCLLVVQKLNLVNAS